MPQSRPYWWIFALVLAIITLTYFTSVITFFSEVNSSFIHQDPSHHRCSFAFLPSQIILNAGSPENKELADPSLLNVQYHVLELGSNKLYTYTSITSLSEESQRQFGRDLSVLAIKDLIASREVLLEHGNAFIIQVSGIRLYSPFEITRHRR